MSHFITLTDDEMQYIQRSFIKEAAQLHLEINRHKMQFPHALHDKDYLDLLNKRAFDAENIVRKCNFIEAGRKEDDINGA